MIYIIYLNKLVFFLFLGILDSDQNNTSIHKENEYEANRHIFGGR